MLNLPAVQAWESDLAGLLTLARGAEPQFSSQNYRYAQVRSDWGIRDSVGIHGWQPVMAQYLRQDRLHGLAAIDRLSGASSAGCAAAVAAQLHNDHGESPLLKTSKFKWPECMQGRCWFVLEARIIISDVSRLHEFAIPGVRCKAGPDLLRIVTYFPSDEESILWNFLEFIVSWSLNYKRDKDCLWAHQCYVVQKWMQRWHRRGRWQLWRGATNKQRGRTRC